MSSPNQWIDCVVETSSELTTASTTTRIRFGDKCLTITWWNAIGKEDCVGKEVAPGRYEITSFPIQFYALVERTPANCNILEGICIDLGARTRCRILLNR